MSRAILRLAAIAAASTGSMLLAAAPALAYPNEIGTKSCATNYHVAAKTRGAGEMYARVHVGIVYANASAVRNLYNTDETWARSNIQWETGAQYNYDYGFSGSYCEHV